MSQGSVQGTSHWRSWDTAGIATALIGAATVSYLAWLGLPVILESLVSKLGFTDEQIGWVGASESLGVLLSSSTVSALAPAGRFRRIALTGIAVSVGADLATLWITSAPCFCAVRLLAGFGSGLCYSSAIAALSLVRNPTRFFSILMVVMTLMNSVVLWLVPVLSHHWGLTGVYGFLALCYVFPATTLWTVPRHVVPDGAAPNRARPDRPLKERGEKAWLAWLCLAAILLFNIAASAFWAYAERIGRFAGLAAERIPGTLTVANLVSLTGAAGAYWMSRTWGQHQSQLGSLGIIAGVYAIWALTLTPSSYVAGIFVFFEVWAVVAVFQLGTLSDIDETGRYVALVPAAQGIGQSAGPLTASALIANRFTFSGMLGVIDCAIIGSLLAYAVVYGRVSGYGPACTRSQ